MTFCRQCGGDSNELILTGKAHMHVCDCGMRHVGYPKGGECGGCKAYKNFKDEGEIPPETKLPSSEPCDKCVKQNKICTDELAKGGIAWRCKDCGSAGVIKAQSQVSKDWRAKNNGENVGLEIGKEQCVHCGEKGGKKN